MFAQSTQSFESFTATSRAAGFDECLVREWAADQSVEPHTHPFDVSAWVARGDFVLTVGDEKHHFKTGDFFQLKRDVMHSESYGANGATVWVARAN